MPTFLAVLAGWGEHWTKNRTPRISLAQNGLFSGLFNIAAVPGLSCCRSFVSVSQRSKKMDSHCHCRVDFLNVWGRKAGYRECSPTCLPTQQVLKWNTFLPGVIAYFICLFMMLFSCPNLVIRARHSDGVLKRLCCSIVSVACWCGGGIQY